MKIINLDRKTKGVVKATFQEPETGKIRRVSLPSAYKDKNIEAEVLEKGIEDDFDWIKDLKLPKKSTDDLERVLANVGIFTPEEVLENLKTVREALNALTAELLIDLIQHAKASVKEKRK